MALELLISVGFGADVVSVAEGAGVDQPQMLSAVCTGPNNIRVTFDHVMETNGDLSVLQVNRWSVVRQGTSQILPVVQVTQVSDAVFDLRTPDQADVTYVVTATQIQDIWHQLIDTGNNSATCAGIAPTYPAYDLLDSFYGLDHGMQSEGQSGFLPDSEPPYLANLAPFSGETGVSALTNIVLEIKDDEDGVDPASVVITVEGTTAWIGETQQPGFSVTKSDVANGFRYVIDPSIPLPTGTVIDVWVYAKDKSALENTLNTSYNFTTAPGSAPIISNQLPQVNATNVALDSTISFHITDLDDDLDPSNILITVGGILAYLGQQEKNGFSVVRSSIALGYSFVITPPVAFDYGAEVEVGYRIEDYSAFVTQGTYSFFTVEDPNCFDGPLNAFEETVKNQHVTAGVQHLERLRVWLLRSVLNFINVDRAVRFVFLRAHEHPTSTILGNLVPAPTSQELRASLCGRRTNIQINNDLLEYPLFLERALSEMAALGLPDKHYKMLRAYIATGNPNDRVPVACVMVLLARALEDNELV